MNEYNLVSMARSVNSRKEFLDFLTHLVDDFENNKIAWDNNTLDSYLSGLEGIANGMDGYYKNWNQDVDVEVSSWRMTAEMLLGARVHS